MVGVIPRYPKNASLQPQAIWKNETGFADVVVVRSQPYVLLPGFTENKKLLETIDHISANKQAPYFNRLKRLRLTEYISAKVEEGDVVYARGSFYRYGGGLSAATKFIIKNECVAMTFRFKEREIYLVSKKHLLTKNSFMFLCLFAPKEISVLEIKNGEVVDKPNFFNTIYDFVVPTKEEKECLSKMLDLPQAS